MKTRLLVVIALFLYNFSMASKPPLVLSGQVRMLDEQIPYANISIKGTTIGTIADAEGNFQLKKLPAGPLVLQVAAVGYKTIELPINSKESNTAISIEMVEDRIGLSEVVITANRYEVNRQEAPVIVNVLNAGLLQASNAVCMADGLNYQPGVRVENNCQNCGFQQVRINGLEGPYSQILIDSRPIFSALSGVYGIEQIPVAMIEKVEVVRGGGSALYGSNAIAGTINIITKEPVNNSYQVGYNLASIAGDALDHNISANGTFVSADRKAGLSLFAVHRNRGHFDANGDGFSELGLINANSVGMRSFYKTSNFSKLTATYHYLSEFRRGGNKFDLKPHETDITEQTDHQIHGGELVFDRYSKSLKSKLTLYTALQHIDRESYYGAQQDLNAYGQTYDLSFVSGAQFNHRFDKLLFAPANITTGVEYQLNSMEDEMPGYNRSLKQDIAIGGFFAQSEWRFKRAGLVLGARADKHNLIDGLIFSPRASMLYDLTTKLQWRGSFSTGYRPPQAFDEDLHILAVNGGVMLIQLDPDLRPEYSKSISTSFDSYYSIAGKENNFMVEGFYTRLDDVFVLETLETDAQGNMLVERRNGSGAVVQGVNIENRTVFNQKVQMQLGATFQNSRYAEPEEWSDDPEADLLEVLPKSPNVYGYFSMTASPTKRFSAHLTGTYTGSMKVPHFEGYIEADAIETTPSFLDINLKISYDFKLAQQSKLRLEAGVQNILNSYQQDFNKGIFRDAGYMYGPMKPRTFFVGLKMGNLL
jgi:outer membrane receptor for ferrienterochelin and colicins